MAPAAWSRGRRHRDGPRGGRLLRGTRGRAAGDEGPGAAPHRQPVGSRSARCGARRRGCRGPGPPHGPERADHRGGAPGPGGGRRPRQRVPQRSPLLRTGRPVRAGSIPRTRGHRAAAAHGRQAPGANLSGQPRVTVPDARGPGVHAASPRGARTWVYGRAGRPCRRCGTLVRSRSVGQPPRRLYWCPDCQPSGVTAVRSATPS